MTRRARAALAALVAAAGARAEAPLGVRAEPPALQLRRDARATVVVDAGGGAPPSLSASLGRIEAPRALGDGRWEATYHPPAEAYPQVAIVTAMRGGRLGWIAIPLAGSGLAVAHARPDASIEVTIGDARFGPVRADRRGEARVPVTVPPGVRFAYHRGKPLDLEVPPTLHVHLAVGRAEVAADAAAELPVAVVAIAEDGKPRAGAPVELEATHGTIDVSEVSPGTFAGTWRLPAGAPGDAVATARLRDEPGRASRATVARPAGAAARILVDAPARVSVERDGPVRLFVRVVDAAGNPVDATPRLETTFGTIADPVARGAGAWEATLAVPRALGAVRRAQVTIRAAALEERVELQLVAGAPERLAVEADTAAIVADGRAAARLRVRAIDRWGNEAAVPAPLVEGRGAAEVSTGADDLAWVVEYRPRRARADAADVLSIRSGELSSTARIALVAPERRVAVAPRLGAGVTSGGVVTPYAGVEASYRPAALGGRLAYGLEVGWLAHERTDTAAAGSAAVEVHGRASYVPVLASATWRQPLGPRALAFAGLGAGAAHVASEVAIPAQEPLVESGFAPAAHASVALGWRVGHGLPFVELRALRFGPPGLEALDGSLTVYSLCAGWRHDAY